MFIKLLYVNEIHLPNISQLTAVGLDGGNSLPFSRAPAPLVKSDRWKGECFHRRVIPIGPGRLQISLIECP